MAENRIMPRELQQVNLGHQRKPIHMPIAPLCVRRMELEKENRRPEFSSPCDEGKKITATLSFDASSHQLLLGSSPSIVGGLVSSLNTNGCSRNYVEKSTRRSLEDGQYEAKSIDDAAGQATSRQPRILRYRETIESLFCLNAQSSEEHKELCRDVVDGPLADDAGTWRRILELSAWGISPTSPRGKDLLRLHRRALSRLATSDLADPNCCSDMLAIWLSYARSQAKYGTIEEARVSFRRIQNQQLGVRDARFYLAVAEVEQNNNLAIALQALKIGIDQKAEPLEKLKSALLHLENRQSSDPSCRAGEVLLDDSSLSTEKKLNIGAGFPIRIPPLQPVSNHSQRKRNEQTDMSPKCLKTETVAIVNSPLAHNEILTNTADSNIVELSSQKRGTYSSLAIDMNDSVLAGPHNQVSNVGRLKRSSSELGYVNLHPNEPQKASQHMNNKKKKGFQQALFEHHQPMKQAAISTASDALPRDVLLINSKAVVSSTSDKKDRVLYSQLLSEADEVREIGKKRRVDLLSKTPRLAKVGINGKAQRVDQAKTSFQSSNQHVDLSMASKPSQSPTEEGDKSIQQTVPKVSTVPKVAKMDLSYILNWDPDARRCNSQNETELNLASGVSENKPSVEKIDEEPSRAGFSTTSSVSTCSSSLNSAPPSPSRCTQEGQPENKVRIDRSSRPDTAALIAKANPEFLPLVTESNILRVNGKPFLKLNVIGSGGSCKVYRALSKDCSVVAIKRVKIDGIDLKTVDGYANEIALLKRLRCNPAIIEMIDSEVDLARKSIFLVLELGEIDLNQAIQQQVGRGGSNASGSRLNMNFIRLTWQQMLQAVHCIHEERIIHGDLKPANFLFVRGVLKLIDFGIAKAIQSEDTTNIYRDDSIIGTLNYLSPEAIQNTGSDKNSNRMKIGRASDIWSLGCILYQMVYGKTPFAELQTIPKLHAIINPAFEIHFPSGADEAAVDAMKLCLRRNPCDRPPIVGNNGLLTEHRFLHTSSRHSKN